MGTTSSLPRGDFNWAANFPGGGVAAHLGHQACRLPLEDFRDKKNEYHF